VIHPAIAQVMLTNGLEGTIAAPTSPAFTTRMSDIVPQLVVFPSRGPRVGANGHSERRVACGASLSTVLCTPVMGMCLWGGSPLWENHRQGM
jgi:hypothetical protein